MRNERLGSFLGLQITEILRHHPVFFESFACRFIQHLKDSICFSRINSIKFFHHNFSKLLGRKK